MNRLFLSVFSLSASVLYAQNPSYTRQMALNNYASYANQSAGEVTAIFASVREYYPRMKQLQKGKGYRVRFECQQTQDDYYFNKAIADSKSLPNAATLNERAKALRAAADAVGQKCKALDTYHKLEDYKNDNYKQAEVLIGEIQAALADYRAKQTSLANELESKWQKWQLTVIGTPYREMDGMMKKELVRERAFIYSWTYNLNEDVHTGWPVDALQKSIQEADNAVPAFSSPKPVIGYPASGMVSGFAGAIQSMLTEMRSGLDGNNYEARQSDKHSNDVYLSLINYYNGESVADHNSYLNYAITNGYYGLTSIKVVPLFEIRTTPVVENNTIAPFNDLPYAPVSSSPQSVPISGPMSVTLGKYIEFINECVHQVNNLMPVLRSFNSDAAYYKDLTSFKGKGKLSYRHEGFQIPMSLYQAAVGGAPGSAVGWRNSLNDQATVLVNILKEIDQLSIALEEDAAQRAYEKDNFKKAYEIIERHALLLELLDARKERLYKDVRTVAESYPTQSPSGSWAKSGKVLLKLVDEDRAQLATVKLFMKGDSASIPSVTAIDASVREILANEFANMSGIQNLGRSNGNDPYTPYEEIPATSRTFSKRLVDIHEKEDENAYMGDYHPYVYLYNDVADYYNKFCAVAGIHLLMTVHQPEYFSVEYPKKKETKAADDTFPVNPGARSGDVPVVRPVQTNDDPPVVRGRVIHDTIKVTDIIRIETRQRDTVYIEKHDTIYSDRPGDRLLSMDGYASNNLIFLLDVSGSMNTGQKLPLLKKSMLLLLKILREEDRVSIVVYSGKARVVLAPTSASQRDKIKKVIENLTSDGATDGNAGIKLAYKTADGSYLRGGNNRIVLATDGEFNISEETAALASRYASQDIFLSVFNFGSAAAGLQKISAIGKGNYALITRQNSDVKLIGEAKGKRK